MRVRNVCMLSLLCLGMATVSGCGSKGTEETISETVMDTAPVVEDYAYEDTEILEDESVEDPGQKLTVSLVQDTVEDEEAVIIPVEEFKKYGKVVKGKDGYRILGSDGYYINDAMLTVGDNHYYFDENGYMQDDVFVPVKDASGKVRTMYIHNYSYVYGWITVDNKQYYIDESEGRLELVSKEIDGEVCYFDTQGRKVSEERYNSLYYEPSNNVDTELDETVEAEVVEETEDMTEGMAEGMAEDLTEETTEETTEEITEEGAETTEATISIDVSGVK